MTDEQITKARQLREEELSYQKVGVIIGVSRETVRRYLNPAAREYSAAYRVAHKEEIAAYNAEHREERVACSAVYRATHKEESTAYNTTYYSEHKDECIAYSAAYYATHREEGAAYRAAHKEKKAAHYAANKDRYMAHNAARRALIAGATVGDIAEIAEIYRQAREDEPIRCYLCGDLIPIGEREVDHVIPVIPNDPSVEPGKHATFNLRIVHMKCNRRKSNKMLCKLDWII